MAQKEIDSHIILIEKPHCAGDIGESANRLNPIRPGPSLFTQQQGCV